MKGNNNKGSNSFKLLARAVDSAYEEGELRLNGPLLFEKVPVVVPKTLDKGKGLLGDEEEVLMMGFSPTS